MSKGKFKTVPKTSTDDLWKRWATVRVFWWRLKFSIPPADAVLDRVIKEEIENKIEEGAFEKNSFQNALADVRSIIDDQKTAGTLSPQGNLAPGRNFSKELKAYRRRVYLLWVAGAPATWAGFITLGILLWTAISRNEMSSRVGIALKYSCAITFVTGLSWTVLYIYRNRALVDHVKSDIDKIKMGEGRWLVLYTSALVAIISAFSTIWLLVAWLKAGEPNTPPPSFALATFLWIISGLLWMVLFRENRPTQANSAKTMREHARLLIKYETRVREDVRVAVKKITEGSASQIFPSRLVRLIERDPSQLIRTDACRRVEKMLWNNPSILLGVRGAGGAGKSSLLERIEYDAAVGIGTENNYDPRLTIRLRISGTYDSFSFLRDLALQTTEAVLDTISTQASVVENFLQSRSKIFRLPLALLAFLAGLVLLLISIGPHQKILAAFVEPDLLVPAFLCWAIAWILLGDSHPHSGLTKQNTNRRELASALHDELLFAMESGKDLSSAANITPIELTSKRSLRVTSTSWTDLEVLRRLKDVLKDHGDLSAGILILVDDLDTLSPEEQRNATSVLKSLTDVAGVRCVVTVSALYPAIDDTFYLNPVTAQESYLILTARCPDIPAEAVLVCYVWSRGHPKKLLQLAERCTTLWKDGATLVDTFKTILSENTARDPTNDPAVGELLDAVADDSLSAWDALKAEHWAGRILKMDTRTFRKERQPDI